MERVVNRSVTLGGRAARPPYKRVTRNEPLTVRTDRATASRIPNAA